MPQMSSVLREREIGLLTAGTSTRAVAIECYVKVSTISILQCVLENFAVGPTCLITADHCLCQRCEQSAPWWWGYGVGRHKLDTTNTIAFY